MPREDVMRFVYFFFCSSRRRHTRLTCDWSSDVCSSDLGAPSRNRRPTFVARTKSLRGRHARSEERRVGKGVDLGGRRIIKKKKNRDRERADQPPELPPYSSSIHRHRQRRTLLLSARRSSARGFFFSSRRRHTRLTCDWSSDVCSSD